LILRKEVLPSKEGTLLQNRTEHSSKTLVINFKLIQNHHWSLSYLWNKYLLPAWSILLLRFEYMFIVDAVSIKCNFKAIVISIPDLSNNVQNRRTCSSTFWFGFDLVFLCSTCYLRIPGHVTYVSKNLVP
jgi:hypothetical protein